MNELHRARTISDASAPYQGFPLVQEQMNTLQLCAYNVIIAWASCNPMYKLVRYLKKIGPQIRKLSTSIPSDQVKCAIILVWE